MFSKKQRHELIINLIENNTIETQNDLVLMLEKNGCDATQATVSRDIRELHLIKQNIGNGRIKYVQLSSIEPKINTKHTEIYLNSVISVESANNLIVVKTHEGLAQAAAVAIDKAKINGVLGCIAGDDTILIVTVTEQRAKEIVVDLNNNDF